MSVCNPCLVVDPVQYHMCLLGLPLHSPFHTCLAPGSGMCQDWMGSDILCTLEIVPLMPGPKDFTCPFLGDRGYKTGNTCVSFSFDLEDRDTF